MSEGDAPTKTISDFEAKLAEADASVASFDRDDRSLFAMVRSFLRSYPTTIPTLVLLISIIAFGIIQPRFLGPGALSTVLQQVTVTGIIAIAQTLVILTAGIDLSVGAILVVTSLIMGNLAVNMGMPLPFAIGIAVFFGGLMGWLNGVLVALIKLPPFIVTLGTLSIFTALKLWYSHSESIRNVDIAEKAP
ncbi:MAG: ABC transporter permease, partial [Devosia sp.]